MNLRHEWWFWAIAGVATAFWLYCAVGIVHLIAKHW